MTSAEIIRKVIAFDHPPRIGFDFHAAPGSDLAMAGVPLGGTSWGDETLRSLAPQFAGQLMRDAYGNLWGRLEHLSKGEVIKGVLQDGWELSEQWETPTPPADWWQDITLPDTQYRFGALSGMPFSIMRTLRGMENFLMDVLLEEERVAELGERVMAMLLAQVDGFAQAGMDGIFLTEDWGTQKALLISPKCWVKLFKPWYARIIESAHRQNMTVFLHSCGQIREIIPHLEEVGIDGLQLDQPEMMGLEWLAGFRVTYHCPVDIQHVMPSGDREMIERSAREMVRLLDRDGGFLAKDYPQWDAIGVREEWADWARRIFEQA